MKVENPPDKERVYGWYPPHYSVYDKPPYKDSHNYEKECMFKHYNSRFKPGKQGLASTPTKPPIRRPTSSAYRSSSRSSTSTLLSLQLQESLSISRPPSIAPPMRSPSPTRHYYGPKTISSQRTPTPTAHKTKFTKVQSTGDYKVQTMPFKHAWRTCSTDVVAPPTPDLFKYDETVNIRVHSSTPTGSRVRVKSATMYRDRVTTPSRPLTAGSARMPYAEETTHISSYAKQLMRERGPRQDMVRPEAPVPPSRTPSTIIQDTQRSDKVPDRPDSGKVTRPTAPAPPVDELQDVDDNCEPQRPPTPDYDDLLDRYGWRVEVHGDPLNIKQIPSRLPYTVKCDEPVIPLNPPKGYMQNYDTFFLNTIPRKPMTCVIHPEWASEVLLEKRLKLQKKTGQVYRQTDYAFLY